ncbi:MAG TPA: YidC/Oxa1 family membrane protein insertase [Negativicutes bacterium]|nr:YidC/Oxa1 family membrane protein insertase [Negativicutes bacterium]
MENILQIFEYIGMPFGYLFKFIYGITGHYLTALLVFGVIVKLVLLPLSIHQQKTMVGRAKLAPQEKAIREKYKNKSDEKSAAQMNQEIMGLYTKNGQSLLGGCLPMLIQMPILFSLYAIITKPLTYICGLSPTIVSALETRMHSMLQTKGTLSQIQIISHLQNNLPAFLDLTGNIALPQFTVLGGLIDLSQTPSITAPSWVLLVPLLTFLSSFLVMQIRQKLNPAEMPEKMNETAQSMKLMQYIMPLTSVWIAFSVPAIIGVYWIMQSILDVMILFVLSKFYPYPQKTSGSEKDLSCSK